MKNEQRKVYCWVGTNHHNDLILLVQRIVGVRLEYDKNDVCFLFQGTKAEEKRAQDLLTGFAEGRG